MNIEFIQGYFPNIDSMELREAINRIVGHKVTDNEEIDASIIERLEEVFNQVESKVKQLKDSGTETSALATSAVDSISLPDEIKNLPVEFLVSYADSQVSNLLDAIHEVNRYNAFRIAEAINDGTNQIVDVLMSASNKFDVNVANEILKRKAEEDRAKRTTTANNNNASYVRQVQEFKQDLLKKYFK